MNYVKSIGILFFFLFLSHSIIADEIRFKNGDRISGQLINLSPTHCTFATPYQAILNIPRKQLLGLHIKKVVTVELHSNERLIGTLTTNQNGRLSLHSQRFGILTLSLAEIKTIKDLKEGTQNHINHFSSLSQEIEEVGDELFLEVQGRGVDGTPKPASSTKASTPETMGEKEEESHRRLFLPQSDMLLLQKGEQELDISISYTYNESNNQRQRNLTFPVEWHVGLTDRLNAFLNVPFTWTEQESSPEHNFSKNNNVGFGDATVGFHYLFVPEYKRWPDIFGSLRITAPTGDEPDLTNPNQVSIGNGHWEIGTGLTVIKSYDPAILFGTIGYTHVFANTFNGIQIAPGDILSYTFGSGFVLNDQIALYSQFIGNYQMESEREGVKIQGSTRESMQLQTYLGYYLGKGHYIYPSLTFGLNDDAPNVILELSYFHQF